MQRKNSVICGQCKHSKDHPYNIHLLSCTNPNIPTKTQTDHETDYSCGYGELLVTNSKQTKTLENIFASPTPNNIPWLKIESLLIHVGGKMKNRGGSRVRFSKDNEMLFIDKPHPQKQTPATTVTAVRLFLEKIGVTP